MGLADKVVGAVKEAAGKLTGNEDLAEEGRAQAAKGDADMEATEDRAKAKAHEAEAAARDAEMHPPGFDIMAE